jgi:hypothetical protein
MYPAWTGEKRIKPCIHEPLVIGLVNILACTIDLEPFLSQSAAMYLNYEKLTFKSEIHGFLIWLTDQGMVILINYPD